MALKFNTKKALKALNKIVEKIDESQRKRFTVWKLDHGDGLGHQYLLMADQTPLVFTADMDEMNRVFDFTHNVFRPMPW